jgi:hypothetical protein
MVLGVPLSPALSPRARREGKGCVVAERFGAAIVRADAWARRPYQAGRGSVIVSPGRSLGIFWWWLIFNLFQGCGTSNHSPSVGPLGIGPTLG